MKNLFFMLAFALVGTFAFANTELNTIDYKDEIKTELLENGDIVTYNISVDEFDICTVTVTITYSDGVVVRGRATSNSGDCDAAAAAAEGSARKKAASIGY
jgi:hypothetical protein